MGEVQEGKVNGHGTEPQVIIPAAQAVIIHTEETVKQMLAQSEAKIAFRRGILKLIAANLDPEDVTLYGEGDKETVHLTKHACKQILSWAGISVQPDSGILEKRYDGTEGPYIDFEVWGTWIRGTEAHRSMGNRSTYDDFFAKRTKWACEACGADVKWENKRPVCVADSLHARAEKTTYYLPLTEVDIPSIKQAAITNLWNHVVEDAGLKPSKKELVAVGFRFDEVKDRVKFGGDKQAPQQTSQKPQASPVAPQGAAVTTPKQPAAAPTPPAVPQKQLPVGKGIVSEVVERETKPKNGKGGGTPFLEVIQNGHYLYCFKNHETETADGPRKAFLMILDAKGQFCEFIIETKDGDRPMHTIIGARRIGRYEWDEQGQPVIRREPGDDSYQATDEDIPF